MQLTIFGNTIDQFCNKLKYENPNKKIVFIITRLPKSRKAITDYIHYDPIHTILFLDEDGIV